MGRDVWSGLSDEMAARARRVAARVWPHRWALAIVLVACAWGQAAMLSQTAPLGYFPDSRDYLASAAHLAANLITPYRAAGYSVVLAAILGVTGWGTYAGILFAQVALTVASIIEIYVLATRVCRARWAGALAASLVALNLSFLAWERSILSETLSIWLLVTMLVLFESYLRLGQRHILVWMSLVAVALTFTRPLFFFMPLVLAAVLAWRVMRLGTWRRAWRPVALVLAVSYGAVAGYIVANDIGNHYLGISYISSVNLFGKILHYNLERDPVPASLAAMRQDAIAYRERGQYEPWNFPRAFPGKGYDANNYASESAYATYIVVHHPLSFAKAAITDALATLDAQPKYYATIDASAWWIAPLDALARIENAGYLVLVALAAWLLYRAWRRPGDVPTLVALGVSLLALANVVLIGADAYDEFYRLRAPADWIPLMLIAYAASVALADFQRRRAAPATPPPGARASAPDDDGLAPTLVRTRAVRPPTR